MPDSVECFGAGFKADAQALSHCLAEGEQELARLPVKSERSAAQAAQAAQIHAGSRARRSQFMQLHARSLYKALVAPHAGHVALSTLAYAAAALVPGLTPTPDQIARERSFLQAEKEEREIDQAIFFNALLSVPEIGADLIARLLQPSAKALALQEQFARMGSLTVGAVHLEVRAGACHLTVNNAACLNAEDDALIDSMETAVDLALLHPGVRVGVLRGGEMQHSRYRGKRVFSAGINLKHLHQGQISYADFLLRREFGYINKMARGLTGSGAAREIPWIAAVDTFAIGGGAQILLVCDRIIACEDSYFSLPAAQEGIVPGAANLRLGQRAGSRLARQIILDGRKVFAHEADAAQLFDEVVPADGMDAAIDAAAARLDSPAVIANRRMLRLAEEPVEAFRAYMAQFALEQAQRMYSDDVLNKVKPR